MQRSGIGYKGAMSPIISVANLAKTYASGFCALKNVNLDIRPGEIFALLGPNGAGKTTLISIICGIVNASQGEVHVDGRDIIKDYRYTRSLIGLVPQELTVDHFEPVIATVTFSRRLFGHRDNPKLIEKILRDLTLWDRRDSEVRTLSGGMKRRLMIAKALSHEPRILFLDEPTAGVDIELRKDMWQIVADLRALGVTIILTTHYIEEAEAIADRVGIIDHGELILVEDKVRLMQKLGKKQLILQLRQKLDAIPEKLRPYNLILTEGGSALSYTYTSGQNSHTVTTLFDDLAASGIIFDDITTRESRLEDIFVQLVRQRQ
jgi:ABC-2 type transport system ATP-binding protein